MADILLIEDDITFARILEGFLLKQGHQVSIRSSLRDAERALAQSVYHLLLLDYRLPDGNGLEMMEHLRKKGIRVPVIIMTGFHDVRTAVRAIRGGAFDYITKPVNPEELLMVMNDALNKKTEQASQQQGPATVFVEGDSPASKQLHEHIHLVAPTNMSVIILGESGTGKEQVARKIHTQSRQSQAPFIAIDCGALSPELAASELFGHVKGAFTGALQDKKGQFEAANGGTLFLDEIGNLSYDIQVKLLRVLQEKVVQPVGSNRPVNINVRIIAATNDDLVKSVENGSFREDLYHRLNEFKMRIPPLRERGDDLEKFVAHFVSLSNRELDKQIKGLSADVMAVFRQYDWPGNLRELKNVVKRAVLLSKGDLVQKEVLPEEMIYDAEDAAAQVAAGSDLKAIQEQHEIEMIRKTLKDVKYNKAKAARLLNIDRKTLYLKMAKYNID